MIIGILLICLSLPSQAQKKVLITYEKDAETRSYTFYANNETFATHTVELTFSLLENFKTSIEGPFSFIVNPGKMELMAIHPIDVNEATNFKYKKKSRKGCLGEDYKTNYQLPVNENNIVKAFEFENTAERANAEDMIRRWYAIGFNIPKQDTIYVAKGGRVVEVIEVVAPEETNTNNNKARLYLEIEHNDCSFGKYEFLNDGQFLVEAGEEVEAGQSLGIMGSGDYSPDIPFRFSAYYPYFDLVTVNDQPPYKKYYWAYLPIKFESKIFEEKLIHSDEVGGTAKKAIIIPKHVYIQKQKVAEKKAEEDKKKKKKN